VGPADLFKGVGGEFHDMERVVTDDGFGCVTFFAHRLRECWCHIHRNRCDLLGTLGSELVEEPVERFGALPLGAPHDLARAMIRDKGEILVVFPPRDLIDPDLEKAVETPRVQFGSNNTFNDSAHGAPCDPDQAGDRGLIGPGSQPRHQRLEI
jgi:hypothetical protein